jgi:hypothetical protein
MLRRLAQTLRHTDQQAGGYVNVRVEIDFEAFGMEERSGTTRSSAYP